VKALCWRCKSQPARHKFCSDQCLASARVRPSPEEWAAYMRAYRALVRSGVVRSTERLAQNQQKRSA
jgi:hypothetical protein